MPRIRIDIYSDTGCPWCYIGNKYLDLAIEQFSSRNPDAVFELAWHPFFLFPNDKVSGGLPFFVLEVLLFPFCSPPCNVTTRPFIRDLSARSGLRVGGGPGIVQKNLKIHLSPSSA